MDSLLKALFSQFDTSLDPFSDVHPEKILAAQFGQMGGSSGTPYGMYGALYGGVVPQMSMPSALNAFAPNDPFLKALLRDDSQN